MFIRRPIRRLVARLRRLPTHSVQCTGLVASAVLAMAAAPVVTPVAGPLSEARALLNRPRPVAPPVVAVAEPAGPVMRELRFEAPLKSHGVNSAYGLRRLAGEAQVRAHKGVDMAAPVGTGVFASAEGRVVRTGYEPSGYGYFVELAHPNGMTTLYAHLSRIDVARGTMVAGGERIGLVGSTGYSTGPHLHFEVRRGGLPINPARVVGRGFQVRVAGTG